RRRRGGHGAVQYGSPQTHVLEQAGAADHAARSDGDSAPSRRNRRKHRGKRGLQGRPLTSAKPAGAPQQESRAEETARIAVPRETQNGAAANRKGRQDSHAHAGHQGDRQAGEHVWPEELYAALDLGTNNCRLLIAQPTRPGQFRVVDAFSRIVRLGEGLAASGRLSDEAMERAIEALRICASKLRNREIRRMRLIATEACRQAINGEEFLSRVVAETGLALEIIDR
ncbi:Ppx/GppA phosphatase family protein, partial [Rhizobium ruizarguesonis]